MIMLLSLIGLCNTNNVHDLYIGLSQRCTLSIWSYTMHECLMSLSAIEGILCYVCMKGVGHQSM